ncbi:MAG: hypothetical protein L3J82_08680 [Planctomycetes bacterium]|nr:hypothetical protein [Planctomycetota bacterium]
MIVKTPALLLLMLIAPSLMAVNVGDTAKNFGWNDSWNMPTNKASLQEFRGQWVLIEVWRST